LLPCAKRPVAACAVVPKEVLSYIDGKAAVARGGRDAKHPEIDVNSAIPLAHASASPVPDRWGRAAMASYFVVSATLNAGAHQASWESVLHGAGTMLDWLFTLQIVAEASSAVLFALGRFAGVIARAWIAYCLLLAFGQHDFWEGGAGAVQSEAMPFMSHLAVATSLVLYVASRERAFVADRKGQQGASP
jgi:uncharacterized membrane protein YphA (DoxX/SURF4 family)